ncbi:transcriptional regulator [Actinosynnema pretiosum]|uniref:Transcriptional regulator n=1 Tax=Actinosynnema pretiosum TaxID=42197 RepID=A0A290ZC73_9PSEU|nr:transcriptional regulator [Actinosynnema pretiosum]ATE56605.1 transcriptional regulator [Actinosynnema pretiosum]
MAGPRITSQRVTIAAVCLLSLLACCGLAWWQWERFSSANGTFQNLGYVLQWPLFGLFPAFMVWRVRRLDAANKAADAALATESGRTGQTVATPVDPTPAPAPRPITPAPEPGARTSVVTVDPVKTPAHDGYDEDDEDEEMAAYNRYLAELHARDTR